MNLVKPDTLRGQTILVVGMCLLLFYAISLIPYVIFSAVTVTLEREEQIADRIGAITQLIDHAHTSDRSYLAGEVSDSKFVVSVDNQPLITIAGESSATITDLITGILGQSDHSVTADYRSVSPSQGNLILSPQTESTIRHMPDLFRIHDTLYVAIDLPDGDWLNYQGYQ